ncbi:unnamed protein product [Knipowitschia caucasica]|uniref:Uncharacterized protein n=1 Tax=Knipowitschia caucasica TaxID=637954 RepID=A0AAV2MGV6_KNICA
MREMMEEMRGDIISRFEAIVADVVKREVTDALAPSETKLGSYASAISDLEGAANDHEQRLTSIQASVSQLQGKVELLTNKCDKLEGGSRLNNIRIVGVVEGTEGPRPTEFVADFLHNLLRLDAKPILDRAHRTLRPRPGDGAPSRPFVVRVDQFQTRNEILCKARESPALNYQGKHVFIFPDFTAIVAKKRAAFNDLKKEFHSCPGIKFGLFFPASLRITLPTGQLRTFDSPDLAMDFVKKNLKTMEDPQSV